MPLQLIGPWQNALEGAAAVLCAVAAMAVVSALALFLLGAGSVGSLWSLTMALTAMAVGGSVTAGSDVSGDSGGMGGLAAMFGGGGGMGPSISGAANVVPLGVTLIGAVVLWVAFSRRLRLRQGHQQRRFTGSELAVRAAGAVGAAMFVFMIVAALGKGSAALPEGAMQGMGGMGGQSSGSSGAAGGMGGGLAELMGGSGGGLGDLMGGSGGMSAMTYKVNAGSAALGAALWAGIVVGAGCLISRRVRLPLGGALDRLRPAWAPSLSAVLRTVLVLAAVILVPLVFIGAAVGGKAGTLAGGALLLAPNALAVVLTLGLGSSWTVGMHPVQTDSSSNPLASMMGGMGGMGGSSGMGGAMQKDRTEHLASVSPGGLPLWLVALSVTGVILLACAYRASRVASPAGTTPLHPYRGPLARHIGMAERFGIVTAVVMGAAAWLVGSSGNFGISMFGSEMGGMRAELTGSVLQTVALGLLFGALVGFAGSLLATAGRVREQR
ncbi:streptophobe family protein [Streptomyces justiciae]|uniref:streptophobe family protein n=1 Tax=Streptomyces justiciae TaxID=2780140 RepID=UPI002117FCED|nr:streptophobe family protein [Streptomyces justiciae]MCW8378665.1 streptophobe family protein [Streptomyces justiciae]